MLASFSHSCCPVLEKRELDMEGILRLLGSQARVKVTVWFWFPPCHRNCISELSHGRSRSQLVCVLPWVLFGSGNSRRVESKEEAACGTGVESACRHVLGETCAISYPVWPFTLHISPQRWCYCFPDEEMEAQRSGSGGLEPWASFSLMPLLLLGDETRAGERFLSWPFWLGQGSPQ